MSSFSPDHFFFDEEWYLDYYPDVRAGVEAGHWASGHHHYRGAGCAEGRDPNPVFEERWYLDAHPDAAAAVARRDLLSGADHFLRFGRSAGRQPSPWFREDWYLAANAQARSAVEDGLCADGYEHFLRRGLREGLHAVPDFDAAAYLRHNPWVGARIRDLGLPGPFAHLLLRGALDGVRWPVAPADDPPIEATSFHLARHACRRLLGSDEQLVFPRAEDPEWTVIVVARDPWAPLVPALRALRAQVTEDVELILVDDGCSPPIGELLNRVKGVRILRHPRPRGSAACLNDASSEARGDGLLFLGGGVVLEPGALAAVRTAFAAAPESLGAVGARLLRPDGSLLESGATIDATGTPRRLGRGRSPFAPEFCRPREVPFCSSAFLATPADVFARAGGFDGSYSPGHLEDADYCLRLGRAGLRTSVVPDAIAVDHDPPRDGELRRSLMQRNRLLFLARHRIEAERLGVRAEEAEVAPTGTDRRRRRPRLLFVDDRVPEPWLGSGFPRSLQILRSLASLGWDVTFQPTLREHARDWDDHGLLPVTVERRHCSGPGDVAELLASRPGCFDVVWVSRPHNMALVHRARSERPELFAGVRVVYDAEAIYSLREERRPGGERRTDGERRHALLEELRLASLADAVVGVSAEECSHFAAEGIPTEVVGYAPEADPHSEAGFESREGLLFVGAVHEEGGPNHDGLSWFLDDVWTRVLASAPDLELHIVGHWARGVRRPAFESPEGSTIWHGTVDDLRPFYARARVFVAPVRYGAGIPLKVLDAVAHGVPVCTTEAMRSLLGWPHGEGLVVAPADEPELFARRLLALYYDPERWSLVLESAREHLRRDADPEASRAALRRALGETGATATTASANGEPLARVIEEPS